jgi:hypothetical protein
MIQNAPARVTLDLSGRWRSIIDPYEAGYRGPHGEPWPVGFFRNLEPRPGIGEYDFDRSELLEVPGDWNSQDARLLYYEGTVWYQTRFRLEERPGVRRLVHFGAANYHAMVWLDGEPLGEHEGGFTPFEFELPGAGAAGEHVLTVKVDNTRRREAVPTQSTDWWNYGGITREVSLLEVPETFVREYEVGLDGPGRVRARLRLDGPRLRQGRDRERDGRDRRAHRVPHGPRRRLPHPAQRGAHLPARCEPPRGGAVPAASGLERRGRPDPAGLGRGPRLQLRAPGPLSPQRDHGARGRGAGPAGLGGDPRLLEHRLEPRADARVRQGPARRDDRARPQPLRRDPLVPLERGPGHRASPGLPGRAGPARPRPRPDPSAHLGPVRPARRRDHGHRRPRRRAPGRHGLQPVPGLVLRGPTSPSS